MNAHMKKALGELGTKDLTKYALPAKGFIANLLSGFSASDETPESGAFASWVLDANLPDAAGWLTWGNEAQGEPQLGDVVVLERVSATGHHVGFYGGHEDGNVNLFGASLGKVLWRLYPANEVRAVRRA